MKTTMRRIIVLLVLVSLVGVALAAEHGPVISRERALTELRAGNDRYVSGQPHAWSATGVKREELSKGQHPLACVITCSDSRVPPEILFDQSLGDVFVVRLAGNVISPEATGSVEYAVEHLHVPVVVVLGHSSCGAVGAAVSGAEVEGAIGTLIERIKPALEAAKEKGFSGEELAAAVVSENARRGAETLVQTSRVLDEGVKSGSLTVLSAVYDLRTGKVNWQTQLAAPVLPAVMTEKAPAEKSTEPAVAPAKHTASAASSAKESASSFRRLNSSGSYANRH